MNGIIAWFARNSVAANLLMFSIIGLGLNAAFNRVPLEIFPDIQRNTVNIAVAYRGASPEETEKSVAIRIEEAIADLQGIDKIYSDALEGRVRLRVELLNGFEPARLLEDIKGRIDTISTFPDDVEQPEVNLLQRRKSVISVVISGRLSEKELRKLSEEVRDDLTALPGITQVELSGLRRYEIAIEIPQKTLLRYGLTLEAVATAIRQSSQDLPAGSIKTRRGEVLLRSLGQAYSAEDFKKIVVVTDENGARVTLEDIATINDGFEEQPLYALFDGLPSAELNVFRTGDQNAITLAARVKDYLQTKQDKLPEGIHLNYWHDRSQYIKLRLNTLITSAWQGGILIFILLALFLRLSVAIWVCVGIPISFFGAIALMPEMGATFNLVSLFAFILVLGIVVDDAIVTGENIYTRMKTAPDSTTAAIEGTQEVSVPVTFGVLTTVVAFIPLLMMAGDRGPLFAQIPAIVIPVLLFSLVESKLILPAHLKHIHINKGKSLNLLQRAQRAIANGLEHWIQHRYRPFLEGTLKLRYITVAIFITVSLVVLSFVLSGRYGYTFFPRIQSETAKATLQMPRGTPIETTEKYLQRIQDAAIALRKKHTDPKTGDSIVQHILTTVGQAGSSRGLGASGQSHIGRVSFEITPPEKRLSTITSSQLVAEWRQQIGTLPGAQKLSFRAEIGHAGAPIDIQLEGQDFAQLKSAAEKIREKLNEYPGVYEIKDSFEGGKEEIKLKIKPSAEQLGLTLNQLGSQVRDAFFGAEAQRIQRGRDDVRVMVRFPKAERQSVGNLETMYIHTTDGNPVPFSEVAEVETGQGFASINRINRQRTINITAEIDKKNTNINQITADLSQVIPKILNDYPGLRYQLEGEQREQRETSNSLQVGGLFVLFMIYALLAIPFQSYLQPLIVMAVIPFSIVGAILGHMLMGMNLSIMSLMGILALAGVVVNDSLVLVDYINRKRWEGMPIQEAVRAAGVARFRPILLTSLTTFAGLGPLILEKSTQAQFLIPMAISLGFGILFATFITLLLVPVSYLLLEDARMLFQHIHRWIRQMLGKLFSQPA